MKYGNLLLLIVVCSVLAIASSKDLNPKVHRAPLRPSKLRALRKAQMKKKRVVAKKRLHAANTVDPGNQQSNSKTQDKCHQHFKLGSSLVINEGTTFYSIASCSNCNTDDVVPLMGFQQTLTTSTLSNLCNSPTSSSHAMCTQILNSATTSTGCQCVDAPFLGTWRNVPPVNPKVRYMIKCSASDGYNYYLQKKVNGSWIPVVSTFLPPPANNGVGAPGSGYGNKPLGGPGLGRRRRRLLQAGTSS